MLLCDPPDRARADSGCLHGHTTSTLPVGSDQVPKARSMLSVLPPASRRSAPRHPLQQIRSSIVFAVWHAMPAHRSVIR